MRMKRALPLISVLLLAGVACQSREPDVQPAPAPATTPETSEPATPEPAGDTTPAPADAAPPASGSPAAVIASQESNWPGVLVEVTEFRRKGSALTARVVLRNQGSAEVQPEVRYDEVYLMDLGAGRKYQVLRDENGAYIAALRPGWKDRWYETLAAGKSFTIWIKFPAPPPDVNAVTLQIPNLPPFEDLPIQDA